MHDNVFKKWLDSSHLTKSNQSYIDQIYEDFLKDPNSINIDWYNMFQELFFEKNTENQSSINLKSNDVLMTHQFKQNVSSHKVFKGTDINNNVTVVIKILQLINSFRIYGHQYAILDPLGLYSNKFKNDFLELKHYKFMDQDIQQVFDTTLFGMSQGLMSLDKIYQFLNKVYCGTIGIEYMHILDITKVLWIQDYFESKRTVSNHWNAIEQKQFLEEIIAAEGLERYLGTKFPGVKRFSLEGSDVLVPMLKEIIRYSVLKHDSQEIFIGMAHRGRLNVLINVLGKNPQDLFNEFYDKKRTIIGSGDVKYHQGLYSNITINKRPVSLYLLSNPSHLEIITPIVIGSARARIDQLSHKKLIKDNNNLDIQNIILPIVIHGDAAISAQGVVQEAFNMSNTHAYNVGGTIHIVINNQVGFTTSNIYDIRSTPYCTDIAKMIQAPVFHVNGDDVNAVILITRFALDFRNKFKHDIIIDLICYRRHGHNESDEPSVTQPIMYQKINKHPTVSHLYSHKLKQTEIINIDDVEKMVYSYRTKLEKESCLIKKWQPMHIRSGYHLNNSYKENNFHLKKISSQYLKELAYSISNIPSYITMHDRVKKIYHERIKMALGKRLFDWGGAEILAYATLLDQGYSIRLSGEDVARGTFFHRHAIIYDQNHGKAYVPLMHVQKEQGSFFVWDSVLSEESALAFEYGYSNISSHNTLVIWEAQFGDFSNGAQIVIDQFISSSEQKWNQLCGLVMLLPHGYEGQGPEHSSCRIERYLQLCAEDNMWVCVPSTPDQIYHILRKQANNNIRKPLIIVSPKSLLRHSMVTASIEDLAYGSFKTIFSETNDNCISNQVNRVVICTGKIYYDLISQRHQTQCYNIAIIRIEQLYPFPYSDIKIVLQLYSHVTDFVWCQEEPKNQGAWYYIQRCFCSNMPNIILNYIGRPDSAAPAVGHFFMHQQQQKKIVNDVLDLN